jgi:hypothetical protein
VGVRAANAELQGDQTREASTADRVGRLAAYGLCVRAGMIADGCWEAWSASRLAADGPPGPAGRGPARKEELGQMSEPQASATRRPVAWVVRLNQGLGDVD